MKSVLFIILFYSLSTRAEGRIAIVDLESALLKTSDGQKAQASLVKEFKLTEVQFKERELKLREKIKDFEKKAMILSEQKRDDMNSELKELSLNLQKDMQKFQMDFQKKQLQTTKPILEKLQKYVAQLAKEKDLDVIINKIPGQILWVKPNLDITDSVVSMYQEKKPI